MKKYKSSHQQYNFNILKNNQGDLMLLICTPRGNIENPQLVYDGKQTATLYRTANNFVSLSLTNTSQNICQDLKQVRKILVCETNKGKIVQEYIASVHPKRTLKDKRTGN